MAIYGAVAFGVLQVADPLAGALALPDSFVRLVVALLLLGFPIALVLAWAFELSPEGVRKTESADPGEIEAIVAQPASKRWPAGLLALAGIVALVVGSVWVGRQTAPVRDLNFAVPEAHASDLSTLAILPFENVGNDEDNEVLASGLHMDLQDQLGRLSALRVTSPMSVREYEATDKGDQEIAAELGTRLTHVKPHGALYNDAVSDSELSDIIARVTSEAPGSPALMRVRSCARSALSSPS